MIRRIASLVAAALVAVGATAAPAHAEDEIGLSRDGVAWAHELTAPLFDPAFRWVPGDVEERTFQVRNDGPSAGELSVDVLATDTQALLASPDFVLEARLGAGPWVEVLGGTTRVQPAVLDLPTDAVTTLTVRGTFRPETTAHMDEVVPFVVRVSMAEAGDIAGVEDDDGDAGAGALPDTGSAFGTGLLWLAAGLVGAGIALTRPRRGSPREAGPRQEVHHG